MKKQNRKPLRHLRRNATNHLSNRRLNPEFEGITPTHKVFRPPVYPNARNRTEEARMKPQIVGVL